MNLWYAEPVAKLCCSHKRGLVFYRPEEEEVDVDVLWIC